jgi:hypothetical protein
LRRFQRYELLPVALEPAGEIEFEQHDLDLSCRDSRGADQLVDIDGTGPELRAPTMATMGKAASSARPLM